MYCAKCSCPLHLCNITGEKRCGLGSFLYIKCDGPLCHHVITVSTGKRNEKGGFDINSKVSIAMVHSGMGPTHVQNFLSTCEIPPLHPSTIRRKENEISTLMVKQARLSCESAREEEKNADNAEGNLETSFDAGWQTRGSGCQYNSNTGHASLIGVKTGKVVDFEVRTKSCSICQYHFGRNETVPQHDCNTNWTGSSKAMEPDMASSMLQRMQDDGFEVGTIHADNDSTTAVRVKAKFQNLQKKCNKNHLKKNLSKWLYKLFKTNKQLKLAGVITYITKLFMHPVSEKNTNEEELSLKLDVIVPHIFGDHSLCHGFKWCAFHKNPASYRFKYLPDGKPLSDGHLKEALNKKVREWKEMVPQLLNLGSTQSNENFNNMVASKAPQNRAYGSTTSLLTRVSAAVLQKNEGYTDVNKVNELALLSPGSISQMHGLKMDKKRRWHKTKHATISYKRKRLLLKKRKQKKETVSCLKEGKTYETDIAAFEDVDVKEIPSKIILKGNENFVIFDLETTGLSRDSDIVQLAAYDGEEEFNAYIRPRQPISRKASEILGITYSFENDEMFHHGTKVQCEDVRVCLLQFMEYLQRKG